MNWQHKLFLLTVAAFLCGCLKAPRSVAPEEEQLALDYIDVGLLRLREGEAEESQAAFELAEELSPQAASIDGLGCVEFMRRNFAAAEMHFWQAYQRDSGYHPALVHLGDLYSLAGEPERAMEFYDKALEIAPESGEARNNLGVLLAEEFGQEAWATKQFLKASLLKRDQIARFNLKKIEKIGTRRSFHHDQ